MRSSASSMPTESRHFHRPASDLAHLAGLHQGRQHRALRVGEDHHGLRRRRAHEPPDAGEHAARADAHHDGVDVAFHLAQHFRPGAGLVRARVRRIGKLVDVDRAGRAACQGFGEVLVIIGVALADVGARGDDVRIHRLRMEHLFRAHLVRHHKERAVALASTDQREAEPGIARGRLDNGAAGLEPAVGLRRLDHGARRSVFQRAGRIRISNPGQPAATTRCA